LFEFSFHVASPPPPPKSPPPEIARAVAVAVGVADARAPSCNNTTPADLAKKQSINHSILARAPV
jgi:hypothetical protein